jgi:hypothetical protein
LREEKYSWEMVSSPPSARHITHFPASNSKPFVLCSYSFSKSPSEKGFKEQSAKRQAGYEGD